ncbi:5'-nucleotidase domain-containing protein [Thraustotheca clavata]|uniref:5'-nucleotidase domain-containing protein n=1 Tax=Thraustotheca clavata TaxID=74557 RepID=A0A1W0A1H5_9STRA|nr:5'-nucleotidase domain-containing protein [Thraustotheca clavata]
MLRKITGLVLHRRCCSAIALDGVSPKIRLLERKKSFQPDQLHNVSPRHIFANNQLRMEQIDVAGFDYDYILCHYIVELQRLIYDMAKTTLIEHNRYPEGLSQLKSRHLQYEILKKLYYVKSALIKSCLTWAYFVVVNILPRMKFFNFTMGSAIYRDRSMKPLNDLFSASHACLFADPQAVHEVKDQEHQGYLDLDLAIGDVHSSGRLHKAVVQDLPKYMEPNKSLRSLLQRYTDEGKKLFVLTNSSFRYIEAGLTYMVGDDWRKFFEITLVSAKKPDFYTRRYTFRF